MGSWGISFSLLGEREHYRDALLNDRRFDTISTTSLLIAPQAVRHCSQHAQRQMRGYTHSGPADEHTIVDEWTEP